MKIKRGDIYQIKLYLEPEKISDHNRRDIWIDWELFSEIWNEICVCFRFSDANSSYMQGCYRIAQKVSLLDGFE